MRMALRRNVGLWRPITARAIVAVVIALAVCIGAPRSARASCAPDAEGVLWSHPANGALGVPIDADLFVTGSLGGVPTLEGEPLVSLASGVYDLGRLEPSTRYEVRWETAVIAFTTGADASPQPPMVSRDVQVTRNPADAGRCPLVPSQGCFDTGPPTRVRFDTGPAVAWLIDVWSCDGSQSTLLWPSVCGTPLVEREDRIVCASLRATRGAGLSESTDVICSAPDVSPETLPQSSACTGPWPLEDAMVLRSNDGVTLSSSSGLEVTVGGSPVNDAAEASSCSIAGWVPVRKRGLGWVGLLLGAGCTHQARRRIMMPAKSRKAHPRPPAQEHAHGRSARRAALREQVAGAPCTMTAGAPRNIHAEASGTRSPGPISRAMMRGHAAPRSAPAHHRELFRCRM